MTNPATADQPVADLAIYKKHWFEGWSYVHRPATTDQQFLCILKLPNAKSGPKKVLITDPVIAGIVISTLDWLDTKEFIDSV